MVNFLTFLLELEKKILYFRNNDIVFLYFELLLDSVKTKKKFCVCRVWILLQPTVRYTRYSPVIRSNFKFSLAQGPVCVCV